MKEWLHFYSERQIPLGNKHGVTLSFFYPRALLGFFRLTRTPTYQPTHLSHSFILIRNPWASFRRQWSGTLTMVCHSLRTSSFANYHTQHLGVRTAVWHLSQNFRSSCSSDVGEAELNTCLLLFFMESTANCWWAVWRNSSATVQSM